MNTSIWIVYYELLFYNPIVFSLQELVTFRTILSVVGSLGLFKRLTKLTSWFPANLAAAGPPKDKK